MLSSVGSTGTGSDSSSSAQTRSQIVDRIFKKVDSNRDGNGASTNSSGQGPSFDEAFNLLDELQWPRPIDAAAAASNSASSRNVSGPPGGGAGAGGAVSTRVSTDPADPNQDGKFVMQEEIVYILQQYRQTNPIQPSQPAIYA